ncbi:MAG: type VI secretion system contractile sheath small subunit [Deltaproteobacteria bacterium]|jgi:type VI secretion system protein ImpB|nr:type VI secretion system contractile sheath small subunit [Deltaproteobacteria bacterium]
MSADKTSGNKDRVNIVYKTAGDGEEKELPFKLLILGDFTACEDLEPFLSRIPIDVNRDNLDQVMGALKPKLELMIPQSLTGEIDPPRIPITLEFGSLQDFQPAEIVGKVGPLKEASLMRSKVMSAQRALMTNESLLTGLRGLLSDPKQRERLRSELKKNKKTQK